MVLVHLTEAMHSYFTTILRGGQSGSIQPPSLHRVNLTRESVLPTEAYSSEGKTNSKLANKHHHYANLDENYRGDIGGSMINNEDNPRETSLRSNGAADSWRWEYIRYAD